MTRHKSENNEAIRICVRDASRMGTQLLADVLRRDRRFRVIDVSGDAESLAAADVHVAVLFCNPANMEELESIRRVRSLRPEIKIIALMEDPARSAVLQVFRVGVRGIFCRSDSYKTLAKCVIKVHNGHVWASQCQIGALVEAIGQPFPMSVVDAKGTELLSPREQHVVHWVAEGLTNREIADRMELSEHTVKNYLFRIFDKLGVSTRAELVLYALSHVAASSETSRNATPCNAAMLDGDLPCDVDCCPLNQFRSARDHDEQGNDRSRCERAYLQLSIATATSALLHDRSAAALLELENRIPASRLLELKREAEERIREAVDAIANSHGGKVSRVSERAA